jgi:hypothetical protein
VTNYSPWFSYFRSERPNLSVDSDTSTLDLMKAVTPQYIVYILGLAPLGLFYEPLKQALGGGSVFLASLVGYLAFLRLVGWGIARMLLRKER